MHEKFLEEARIEAIKATCLRAKCGSVIVHDNQIIGRGFNSPPKNLESQRRCLENKTGYSSKITDKTCCIHAEQRAIFDALQHHPDLINKSTLYFMRVNKNGEIMPSGEPYCTMCSKSALDVGIQEWVLLHSDGIKVYNSEDYNNLSFEFKE